MKFGVVRFPGSCDEVDAQLAARRVGEAVLLWHSDRDLRGVDAVVVPGGFSYGDYLRTGAIARFAPALRAVREFADRGGPVLGICNGFQILCEAGLLPGALIRNRSLHFVCRFVHVRVETQSTPITAESQRGDVLEIPVKHGEGQFVCSEEELRRLQTEELVVFRYATSDGAIDDDANPNGSLDAIAGVRNDRGNVVGMMPHPEHAVDPDVGPTGGRPLFESLLSRVLERVS